MPVDPQEHARRARSAGCLGALIGIPVFLFLLVISSLAECFPVDSCNRSLWRELFAPSLAVTLLAGLCGYWVARWWQRR